MNLENATDFSALSLEADGHFPRASLTFILKGTFDLVPGGICAPAEKQRKVVNDKIHMDDLGRSLAWAGDLAPYKPHTDFLIHGSWYAPGGVATTGGRAGFVFGPLRKELLISGPRVARRTKGNGGWFVGPTQPVTTVPLRWELSYGGLSDRRNPMGRGQDAVTLPDGTQEMLLPQIEDPDQPLTDLEQRPTPANFAPVPRSFAFRHKKLGTRDRRWATFRAPLPPLDYDPSFHNAAPEGQQAANSPVGNEELTLINLHPKHPRLTTRLPGLRAQAAVLRKRGEEVTAEAVPMRLDTVVALPDEEQLVLVWRGNVPLDEDEGMDGLLAGIVATEPVAGPPLQPDLPTRLLRAHAANRQEAADRAAVNENRAAAAAAAAAEAAAGRAATEAQTFAEMRKMAAKANFPPDLLQVISTETNPETILQHLDAFVTATFADIERQFPGLIPKAPP